MSESMYVQKRVPSVNCLQICLDSSSISSSNAAVARQPQPLSAAHHQQHAYVKLQPDLQPRHMHTGGSSMCTNQRAPTRRQMQSSSRSGINAHDQGQCILQGSRLLSTLQSTASRQSLNSIFDNSGAVCFAARQAEAFLKRYLEYCRSRCSPRLDEDAAKALVDHYGEMREKAGTPMHMCHASFP